MTKEYLKMADMFELPVNDDDRKAAVDLFSHMVTTPYSVDYTVTMSKYAAHAINSHDELVAENERLRNALTSSRLSLSNAAMNMKWFDIPKAQEILREINSIDRLIS